jgi:hypothetical protein
MTDLCELERNGEEVAATYFKVIVWSSARKTEEFLESSSVRTFISASLNSRASRM